jgi:hypothetical protein
VGEVKRLFVALLLIALPTLGGACAHGHIASSLSPSPAKSVSALPGRSVADIEADRAAYKHMNADRIVQVFVRDGAPAAKVDAMAWHLAAMPEVVAYHFFDKKEAAARFIALFGEDFIAKTGVQPSEQPAFFEILVRARSEGAVVARRFFHDPSVDSDPGTHNGIMYDGAPP